MPLVGNVVVLHTINSKFYGSVSGAVTIESINSHFEDINISPTETCYFYDTRFTGSVTIENAMVEVDATSYRALNILGPAAHLDTSTIVLLQSSTAILNDSVVTGDTVTDALNNIQQQIDALGSSAPLEAAELINAGQFVNIFNDTGTLKLRLADHRYDDRYASGYIKETVNPGEATSVYKTGLNPYLTGLTAGETYCLGTSGNVLRDADLPSWPTLRVRQVLGEAINTGTLDCMVDNPLFVIDFIF